jgi:hypothetical protein
VSGPILKWGVPRPNIFEGDEGQPEDFVHDEVGLRLAGLTDGEGCFFICPVNGRNWRCGFTIKMRLDDRPLLEDALQAAEIVEGEVVDEADAGAAGTDGNQDEAAPAESAESAYARAARLAGGISDREALENADQHDLQMKFK